MVDEMSVFPCSLHFIISLSEITLCTKCTLQQNDRHSGVILVGSICNALNFNREASRAVNFESINSAKNHQ